jgi:iron complex outermembrane receptor protein
MFSARMAVLLLVAVACAAQTAQPTAGTQTQHLKSLSLEQLGNVEVTTQSKEPTQLWNAPAAVYVLSNEDIRRSGVTSVPDALRLVPGLNVARVSGSRNWAIGIRGLGDQYSKYVLVLIDGRSVYTPLFGGVLWTIDNVMLEDIDRIEVIRGPGGTIWGADAVNGIINIITKPAQDTKGPLLSTGGGNIDQNTEDARYGSKFGNWHIRGDAFGFVRSPEFHPDQQPHYDWSRFGQVGFRADRKEGANEITVQGDAYWGKFGDAQSLSTYVPPAASISYASTNASGGDILGRWRREFSDHSDLYLQGFWSHDHRIGSNFGEDRDTFDLDFLHRLAATKSQQFTYGLGLRLSPSTVKQVIPTATFDPLSKTDSIYSAFLQEELHIVPDKLSFVVGSKLEHNNYTGFEYQPNGRLLFTPTPTFSAWAALSRAVRTPDRVDEDIRVDIFAVQSPLIFGRLIGNHALRAERLVAYEGGARALIHRNFYLSVAAFHNAYHDLIAQGPATISLAPTPPFPPPALLVTFQYINGIRGSTEGAEIAPDWQVMPWWKIRAAYSYLHFNLQDQPNLKDTLTLTALHGSSPNSQASLHSQVDLTRTIEFDQMFRFVGALPAETAKAYVTADTRLGWNPTRSLSLSVTGQNLFAPRHAEFNLSPGPAVLIERSVYARIVWTR